MDKQYIGLRIKRIRKSKKLTLQQFAALYNSTRPTSLTTTTRDISKYECGVNSCPAEKYEKFLSFE